jgi:poly(3-hydroxybutyrate) depolymerase
MAGGNSRTYVAQIPANYNPNTPLPEIFVFHGSGGSSASSIAMGLQNATGADQAIYLFPDGINFQSFGVGWDQACNGYDMPFVDAMKAWAESNYCIDTNRRFATGYSWGGDLVDALICCQGDQWRAMAVGSGDEMDYNPTASGVACANVSRPAFRITYGSGDPNGGGDGAYTLQQFTDEVTFMKTALTCGTTSTASSPSPCVSWDGCSKPLIECNYPGLGHNLPSTWAQNTWDFFAGFP